LIIADFTYKLINGGATGLYDNMSMVRDEMKICVTGLRGIPAIMGGIESHCEELLPRVKRIRANWQLSVLGRRPYLAQRRSEYQGVLVKGMPSTKRQSLEAIIGTFTATVHARLIGAKLLHIHAVGPALLSPLARLLGMRLVVTHHGEDYNRAKWGRFSKAMLRLGEQWAMTYAHRIIVVAPSLAERLKQQYPQAANRIRYIPNGTAPLPQTGSKAAEILAQANFLTGDYVLAVGRLVPEKAFDLLVSAFEQLPNRKLLIVGAADHDNPFARRLLNRADKHIVFAGLQSRATLRELYIRAGLFVLPSWHEGLPIAALEAGSIGTPMLLSDISANRDLGLPEQHYFKLGALDELTAAISKPFRNFAVDAKAIRTKFDWGNVAEQTVTVYEELLG
jgi:glycosyltransferase involved in cell wall biosynthesis